MNKGGNIDDCVGEGSMGGRRSNKRVVREVERTWREKVWERSEEGKKRKFDNVWSQHCIALLF